MRLRKLGDSGIEIAPLVLGGNVFGWTIDAEASFRILDAFVDSGMNAIDTADMYSTWVPGHQGGESETIIGEWLKRTGKRAKVAIFTKVGMPMGNGGKGLRKEYILREAEESLRRLQTDYIDLYQSHTDDAETPLQETLEAYAQLIREGKVRAIGASNYTGERLAMALKMSAEHGLPKYTSLQPQYNLAERSGYETDLEPVCQSNHLGVIPYYSLASGFLSGKYRSEADLGKSPRGGGVKKYLNERGMKILAELDALAEEKQSTPAQVALAWLMARPSITAPIASATNLEQLKDLVAATQLEMMPAQIKSLDEASE